MPRKNQSGAASLRARGLVGMPLSLTREEREQIRRASLAAGMSGVSDFAVPALLREAEKIIRKKDKNSIDS